MTASANRPSRLRAIRALAAVDFRLLFHDPVALFAIIVMPVLIIIVIGTTVGSGPRHLPIGVLDLDGGPVASLLVERLGGADAADVERYTSRDDLDRDIRTEHLVAGLVIPADFSAATNRGDHAEVQFLVPQSSTGGQAAQAVVQSATDQVSVRLGATAFVHREVPSADAAAAVDRASGTMRAISIDTRTVGQTVPADDNQFSYTAPSNLVLFVFLTSLVGGGRLVDARRLGITRRVMAAPVRPSTLLLGVGSMRYLTALLQAALILVIGGVFFGVTWGPPAGVLAVVLVYALVGTAAGLLVGAVAENPDQSMAIGIPASIGMGMLGGCMWPLEIVPGPLRAVGHVVPQAWAMDAFVDLIYNGENLGGILPAVGVLALYAVTLLTLATVLLRRKLTR
jgi:ABC-2 type transport system permease protein